MAIATLVRPPSRSVVAVVVNLTNDTESGLTPTSQRILVTNGPQELSQDPRDLLVSRVTASLESPRTVRRASPWPPSTSWRGNCGEGPTCHEVTPIFPRENSSTPLMHTPSTVAGVLG